MSPSLSRLALLRAPTAAISASASAAALAGKGRGKFSRLQPLEKAQIVEIIRADGADTAAYRRHDARSAMGAWLTINLFGFSLG